MIRVLAVDPGLTRCGVGVVTGTRNRQVAAEFVGVIRTEPAQDLSLRLHQVHSRLTQLVAEYQPDQVCVERVFSQVNTRTAMNTAQASAMVMLVGAQAGLPVTSHTPTAVKAAVTGSGRADKSQVTHMVQRLLRLAQPPKPADAADALALGICHLWNAAWLPNHGSKETLMAGDSSPVKRVHPKGKTEDRLPASIGRSGSGHV